MLLNLLFSLTAFVTNASTKASAKDDRNIKLSTGTFRGFLVNGIDQWRGIPFAEPPVGPLRFKAPVPIKGDSRATKSATEFGDACPQPADGLGTPPGAPISEDCLYLNVNLFLKMIIYAWLMFG